MNDLSATVARLDAFDHQYRCIMNDEKIMETFTDWLAEAETQRKLRLCAERAIEIIEKDVSLRVPRTEHERLRAFNVWLTAYRGKLGPAMLEQFLHQFPALSQQLSDPDIIKNIVEENVWPLIEPTLQHYAVRGLASDWVRRHLGDAVLTGIPEFHNGRWEVPLVLTGVGEGLGRVALDSDGNVLPDLTSSRDALLKAAHDRRLPAVAAGAGQ